MHSSNTAEDIKHCAVQCVETVGIDSHAVVRNMELTDPQAHIFNGYTNKLDEPNFEVNHGIRFHEPNKVDFEVKLEENLNFSQRKELKVAENPRKGGSDFTHLVAGGIAGCVASIVTCPLDVIKTRQQASGHSQGLVTSRNTYLPKVGSASSRAAVNSIFRNKGRRMQMSQVTSIQAPYFDGILAKNGNVRASSSILQHYRYIMKIEGARSLYKGLGPTLVGVIPSRAIYFYAYSSAKNFFVRNLGFGKDSSSLHLVSAGVAGVTCTTATSPLWVIKTKLQLHHRNLHSTMNVRQCCAKIWNAQGIKGFYRGITASYAGILETVIHFVIYEKLKLMHNQGQQLDLERRKLFTDYVTLMMIAALSKTTATCVAYPHEVVRTRLREETTQKRYRGFFQTLFTVAKTEGVKALYRGLGTQIVRQVPNMAIVMGTYEFIIDAASKT